METINIKTLPIQAGDWVLDLGCGEGRHAIATNWHWPEANVIGLDLNISDLQHAKEKQQNFISNANCTWLQGNGENLPFMRHSFDHIICSEVLEHIQHYPLFLAEIQRCLKPGGTLSISVPRYWPEKICWFLSKPYHQVDGGHLRIFNAKKLISLITQHHFKLTRQHWAHALHSIYWWLRCLFWKQGENFFPCRLYHQLLVWDLLKRPALTRHLENALNPIMGKSIVCYFEKQHEQP